MPSTLKKLSSPFATGGGGTDFEHDVQSAFVVLMLVNGVFYHLGQYPICQIDLQAKYRGFNTDDMVVYCADKNSENSRKMIAQIKHKIKFSEKNEEFKNTIIAAWADYNNKNLFNKNKDIIAIITGLLPENETNAVRGLLDNARTAKDFNDFNTRLNLKNFVDKKQQDKFQVIKSILSQADGNVQITDDVLYEFLKSLHLFIYDLDVKGITLSLLKSLIEQHSPQDSTSIWAQIQSYVRDVDKSAGSITIDRIPDEIRAYFKTVKEVEIPDKYVNKEEQALKQLNLTNYAYELAQAFLIGSWNENMEADKQAVSMIVQKDYAAWISKMREIIQYQDSPLILKNGIWNVKDRLQLFYQIKSMIFDADLDALKNAASIVLKEKDPQFELDTDKRFMAQLYDKIPKHSANIRSGIVEGLAIIGSNADEITYCSKYKPENTIYFLLDDIFKDADWQIWAGLNQLLPLLFEASPKKMLENVENELSKKDCIFKELYRQEGKGAFGGCCYMTGILWGLERLAWSPEFLSRATLILGELASIDPGGNWGNRPANSLIAIFLPWYPQTLATVQQRINSIKTLSTEFSDITWDLLIALLPSQHQTTGGTAKPVYRNYIPQEWDVKVSEEEYVEQVLFYSDYLIEQAKNDIEKIKSLLEYINTLPMESLNKYLDIISSDTILSIAEDDRISLWEELKSLIARHKHFPKADWSIKGENLDRLEEIANKLEPKNPINKYARLFERGIFEEFEEPYEEGKRSDYNKTNKKVETARETALNEILAEFSFWGAIGRLLRKSNCSNILGLTLGKLKEKDFDNYIIPKLLNKKNQKIEQFVAAYISAKFSVFGWEWIDKFSFSNWTNDKIALLYTCLPFHAETWNRVASISKEVENLYWETVEVYSYGQKDSIGIIIDKLIKYKRPADLVECINTLLYENQSIASDKIILALNMLFENNDNIRIVEYYQIIRLIEELQNDSNVSEDDLLSIEIKYFPLLDGTEGVRPVTVNRKLCKDAEFFCECIQLVYKSDKEDKQKKTLSEQDKSAAEIAWKILNQWKTLPGTQENCVFNEEAFENWYSKAIKICTESGHLDVCKLSIGHVLFYSPKDKSGLFINKTVANLLNRKENKLLRSGYKSECIESRGVHVVDKTAKQEKELAEKYIKQAQDLEAEGFARLAVIMKEVAESYEDEAKRIIETPYL